MTNFNLFGGKGEVVIDGGKKSLKERKSKVYSFDSHQLTIVNLFI